MRNSARKPNNPKTVLRVQGIEITDEYGNVRMGLGTDEEGMMGLCIICDSGERIEIGAHTSGTPRIAFFDGSGNCRFKCALLNGNVVCSISDPDANVSFQIGEDGHPEVRVTDDLGNASIHSTRPPDSTSDTA